MQAEIKRNGREITGEDLLGLVIRVGVRGFIGQGLLRRGAGQIEIGIGVTGNVRADPMIFSGGNLGGCEPIAGRLTAVDAHGIFDQIEAAAKERTLGPRRV